MGADRIHTTGLGLGKRTGNTALKELVVNLNLAGLSDYQLKIIPQYSKHLSSMTGVKITSNQPIIDEGPIS